MCGRGSPLVTLKGLKLADRRKFLRALGLSATYSLDFEDALTVAHMEQTGLHELYRYDRDFDRLTEVKRIEP